LPNLMAASYASHFGTALMQIKAAKKM